MNEINSSSWVHYNGGRNTDLNLNETTFDPVISALSLVLVLGPGIPIHCGYSFHSTWWDPCCSLASTATGRHHPGNVWTACWSTKGPFYANGLFKTSVCLWTVGGSQDIPGNSIQALSQTATFTCNWASSITTLNNQAKL